MYVLCTIVPVTDGSGEWQSLWPGDDIGWEKLSDLFLAVCGTAMPYMLGSGYPFPKGLEDISGRVRNPPDRIFRWVDDSGEVKYFGVEYIA